MTDTDGTSVYVHRLDDTKYAGTYPNWQIAREVAERIAREIGVHGYSFDGLWRSSPPTSDQLKAIRNWDISIPPKLTRGKAADLISLAVAESINPYSVTESWHWRYADEHGFEIRQVHPTRRFS